MKEFRPLDQLRRDLRTARRKGEVFVGRLLAEHNLRDEARFLKSWLDNPLRAGAISPSGKALTGRMARFVDPASDGLVLELGPGTGPVTEALLARGIAEDRLVLIEYDPDFCALLRRRFPKARVIEGDAYALSDSLHDIDPGMISACVSSLPLMSRPECERIALVDDALGLMAPCAPFIQFTYAPLSPVPLKSRRIEAHSSERVWRNLPPATVWVYRSLQG